MSLEALETVAMAYAGRAPREAMEPEEVAEAAFLKLAGLLAAEDASRPVDVEAECPYLAEPVRRWLRGNLVHCRAERIRTGTATARDLAVAFLLSLEADDPDWWLADWAAAMDAPFVLLLLFGEPPLRRSKTHVTMRWASARLHIRVELDSGKWVAKRADAEDGPAECSGNGYGDLASLRWDCKRGAALIKLAKLIAKGSTRR